MGISNKLDILGIQNGDMLLIHSSISRVAKILFPTEPRKICEEFIVYLREKVGSNGTLIFPTFNFGFCSGKPFSLKTTKSQTGALTIYAMSLPDAIRTNHPIYSFAVIGKHAKEFAEIDNRSAYGEDSIFGELRRYNGKIMIIDLSYNQSMTFFHHVEEMEKVDYRYQKEFTGQYIDKNGNSSVRTYTMFVRDLDRGVETEVEPMGEIFERSGQVTRVDFDNGCFIKIMKARELYDFTVEHMRTNPQLLYKITK
jgi:aminoglycoside 3-N-acetyltransferase